jgi:hypothetical protein
MASLAVAVYADGESNTVQRLAQNGVTGVYVQGSEPIR